MNNPENDLGLRQHAKDIGVEDILDVLTGQTEVVVPKDRPNKAEIQHRKRRKIRGRIVKASRKRNRK